MLGDYVDIECDIRPGLHPKMRNVRMPTSVGGWNELDLSESFIHDGRVRLPVVTRRPGEILVEYPTECANGHWRAWVRAELCRGVL